MFGRARTLLRETLSARPRANNAQPWTGSKLPEGWPAGHFYSPIPALEELQRDEHKLFAPPPRNLPDIDLNEAGQKRLFQEMLPYYVRQPFQAEKQTGLRYFFDNPNFGSGEAIILSCLMQRLNPVRMVEIGSGYSSCAILDIDELFLGSSLQLTLVEPYPELALSLMRPDDAARIRIYPSRLQDVPLDLFEDLRENDILFVDSSHVSKTGSDVNHLFFEVFPRLSSGVYIHIHDIYYPFEYPKQWVYQGRCWNEAYMLRTFLQNNAAFEVAFFNAWWGIFEHDLLARDMPQLANHQGSSLWLRKR